MAQQLGLTDATLYAEPHQAGGELPRRARPGLRRRALGGAERLLAVDDRGRDRRARRRGATSRARTATRCRPRSGSASPTTGSGSIKGWTVTTNGPLAPHPYFIRLSKTGDPNAAISYNVGQRRPDARPARGDRRRLPRAGAARRAARRRTRTSSASLPVVDATIKSTTPSGPGWHRYNGDGYGDRGQRRPAVGAERPGHRASLAGAVGRARRARARHRRRGRSGVAARRDEAVRVRRRPDPGAGLGAAGSRRLAVRHRSDPRLDRLRERRRGRLGLAADLVGGVVRPARGRPRRRAERRAAGGDALALRRPHAGHDHADRDEPGRQRRRSPARRSRSPARPRRGTPSTSSATNTDANSATTVVSATARRDGSFSIDVPVTGGTSVLNVVAVSPTGGTAHAKRTVVFDFVPGTLLLDVTDPDGDDNGPGNYAYPTSGDFHAGRLRHPGVPGLRLRRGRHLPAEDARPVGDVRQPARRAARRRLRARSRRRDDLDRRGAPAPQLHDRAGVRVEPADPGAGLRPALRRRERQRRSGRSRSRANAISRFITFSVPKASLGQPGPGWGFTVVLTGQDGFSPDQARGFQPTPQDFQFGVCADRERRPALHGRSRPRSRRRWT